MKKFKLLLAALIIMIAANLAPAQVSINTDNSDPDASAILDVKSTTMGIILPRMTEAERNAISNPAEGLIVYCTDCNSTGYYYYNGNSWKQLSSGSSYTDVSITDPGIMYGCFVIGQAFSNNTATFIISNNGLTPIGPIDLNNAASIGTGTATFSVGAAVTASTDYSGVTIDPSVNKSLIYNIAGTPSTGGTVVVDFSSIGDLNSSATASITYGNANFDLPVTKSWLSVSGMILGTITDGEAVDVVYSVGGGNYDAWTSPTYNITDNNGAIRTITLSNTSGSFSNSGTLTYTINITDGGPAYIDVPQQAFGASVTMATIDIQVNGSSEGNLILDANGGYPDPEYGNTGHNYLYLSVDNTSTGETWLNNNLGAAYSNNDNTCFNINQQAISNIDANAYGDLYQWGRYSDGHEQIYRVTSDDATSNNTTENATTATPNQGNTWDGKFIREYHSPYDWLTPQDDNLWQGVSGTNNPCPDGFRLPTETEFNEEKLSWSSNNSTGAYGSNLKLTMAGNRYNYNGNLYDVNYRGTYWISTVSGSSSRYLFFTNGNSKIRSDCRANGNSVRCIKD